MAIHSLSLATLACALALATGPAAAQTVARFPLLPVETVGGFGAHGVAVDGTHVAFGGGADATVLLDLASGERTVVTAGLAPLALALDGDVLVVGDSLVTLPPFFGQAGTAKVLDASTGQVVHTLTAAAPAPFDNFGVSVAVSGSTILVGEPGDDTVAANAGTVWVYDAVTGNVLDQLFPPVAAAEARFGRSVALDGDLAVIGAPGYPTSGGATGAALSFEVSTGNHLATLEAPGAQAGDEVGFGVDLDGTTAIVGHPGDFDNVNDVAAHLFDAIAGTWLLQLDVADPPTAGRVGESVALDGDVAVVGALRDDTLAEDAGALFVYDAGTGAQTATFTAGNGGTFDYLGGRVAVDDGLLLGSSAAGDPLGASMTYGFDLTPDTWYHLDASSPGAQGHRPALTGSGSLVAGTLVELSLTDGPPSTPTFLVIGLDSQPLLAKNAVLLPRLDVLFAGLPLDANGDLSLGGTWPAGVPSGTHIFFQTWTKDASPPTTYYAVSNALLAVAP